MSRANEPSAKAGQTDRPAPKHHRQGVDSGSAPSGREPGALETAYKGRGAPVFRAERRLRADFSSDLGLIPHDDKDTGYR